MALTWSSHNFGQFLSRTARNRQCSDNKGSYLVPACKRSYSGTCQMLSDLNSAARFGILSSFYIFTKIIFRSFLIVFFWHQTIGDNFLLSAMFCSREAARPAHSQTEFQLPSRGRTVLVYCQKNIKTVGAQHQRSFRTRSSPRVYER